MKFRPDIQILRAIAVLSVILNHSKFSFKSGELGVDIFFVISGYLITGLLVNGNVKLGYFYAKRAKRILPSAMAVIFLTLIASSYYSIGVLKENLSDAIHSGIFTMNWHLVSISADYYKQNGNTSLLQHFWSLAVEEQFYIFWPIITIVLLKNSRKKILHLTSLLFLGSLALYLTHKTANEASGYFATQNRVWELSLGALVLLANKVKASKIIKLISLTGIFYLLVSSNIDIHYSRILVVFLAGILLSSESSVNLSYFKPLIYIGEISFVLYLTHWPVYEIISRGFTGRYLTLLSLFISLLFAIIIHLLIENPVRFSKVNTVTTLTIAALVLSSTTISYTLVKNAIKVEREVGSKASLPETVEDLQRIISESSNPSYNPGVITPKIENIHGDLQYWKLSDNCPDNSNWCTIPHEGNKKIVILGDSHVTMWITAIMTSLELNGYDLVAYSLGGCPPTKILIKDYNSPVTESKINECNKYIDTVTNELKKYHSNMIITTGSVKTAMYWRYLEKRLLELKKYTDREVVIGDFHYAREDVIECLSMNLSSPNKCAIKVENDPYSKSRAKEREAALNAGAEYISPLNLQCGPKICPVVVNGIVVYRDGNHFTQSYTTYLGKIIGKELKII